MSCRPWLKEKFVRILGILFFLSPAFLSPTSDAAPKGNSPLHILIYGDAGAGNSGQYEVARAMAVRHRQRSFDFAVSTGDNFYIPTAPNIFKKIFEDPYAELIGDGVRFYQTVGNHDMEENRLAEELAYSRLVNAEERGVGGWVLPAENYVVRRPGMKWVILNVAAADNSLNYPTQTAAFAAQELCEETTDWKILSVHYPLWSTGLHGDNQRLQEKLLPLFLRCKVDFVFSGHDHQAELMLPWQWTSFAVVGNGHEVRNGSRPSDQESLFVLKDLGFAELTLTDKTAYLAFFDTRAADRYGTVVQKRVPFWADIWQQSGKTVLSRVSLDSTLVDSVSAECGFSSKYSNPILHPDDWTYTPSVFVGPATGMNLYTFKTPLPAAMQHGYAVCRFKLPTTNWIYGDRSDGAGLHGNYDGIQKNHLLRFTKR